MQRLLSNRLVGAFLLVSLFGTAKTLAVTCGAYPVTYYFVGTSSTCAENVKFMEYAAYLPPYLPSHPHHPRVAYGSTIHQAAAADVYSAYVAAYYNDLAWHPTSAYSGEGGRYIGAEVLWCR